MTHFFRVLNVLKSSEIASSVFLGSGFQTILNEKVII